MSDVAEGKKWVIGGVLMVHRTFPSAEFLGWPRSKREDFLLEFVSGVVRNVFVENDLDVGKLDEAAASVVRSQFRNVMVGKTKFRNAATGTVAHIECDQELSASPTELEITTRTPPAGGTISPSHARMSHGLRVPAPGHVRRCRNQ
jgi:hypothetical protein